MVICSQIIAKRKGKLLNQLASSLIQKEITNLCQWMDEGGTSTSFNGIIRNCLLSIYITFSFRLSEAVGSPLPIIRVASIPILHKEKEGEGKPGCVWSTALQHHFPCDFSNFWLVFILETVEVSIFFEAFKKNSGFFIFHYYFSKILFEFLSSLKSSSYFSQTSLKFL